MKKSFVKRLFAGFLTVMMLLVCTVVPFTVNAAGEVSLNEDFSNYTGGVNWSKPNNYSNGVRVRYGNAEEKNFPDVTATDTVDGRNGGYMKMVTTSNNQRPYVYVYLNNDTNGWDQTSSQKSVLSVDFALSEANVPLFIGGYLAYKNSFLKYRNSADVVHPFLQISSTSATAWGNTVTLKESLSVNKWHTAKLYSNGDKTFTLYIDDTVIFANQAFNDKGIKYIDKNKAAVDAPSEFEGFSQLWLYCGSAKETDKSICYDNLSLSVEDGHYAGLYTEDFSTYVGGSVKDEWKTNDGYPDVTAYIDGTTDTFPKVTSAGAIGGKTKGFLPICYTSANQRAYAAISRKDVTGWKNNKDGATKLSVDFALSDLNSSAFIGGYILHYDENGKAMQLKYRDSGGATGAFIRIDGKTVSAWNNTATLQTPLETNKWYTATLYMNGDFTYSLYIDDMPIFLNKSIYFDTFGNFYDKTTESTVTPENFLGFTQIWLQRGSKQDTANSSVYYDNVKLVTANQYYVADTSSEDLAKVQAAADALQIYTEQVENGLALDSLGLNETSITWKSSDPSVITDNGIVYPCIGEEKIVTMTATVKLNSTSVTKDFEITVPAVNSYKITGVKITGDDGIIDNALVGGKTVSKVSVKRYSESADEIIVLTALYKTTGSQTELEEAVINKVTPAMEQYAYGDIELANKIILPEDVSDYKLKVMIWDGAWSLNNLADDYAVEPEDNSITVYTAGDSTVQTYSANYAPQEGWGQNLAYFLTDEATVDNSQSMGGRSSRSFVAEERLKYIEDIIQPGDYLLVQFGHNDVKTDETKSSLTGLPIIRNATINDEYNSYAKYLEIYVDMAQEKGANVILVTSVNRVSDRTGKNLGGYPEAMEAFAAKKNIPVLDLTAASIALQKELEDTTNVDPKNLYMYWRAEDTRFDFTGSTQYSNASDYADSTHFNKYGAKCIAQLIANELKEIGSPLSRFVDETKFFDVIEKMPTPLYK